MYFILNYYLPGWFRIRLRPHIQDGARNLQYLLDLSRSLPADDQEIVRRVMAGNSHWAHSENVSIACLSDPDEEVRRKGVRYIMDARSAFKEEEDAEVRKFTSAEINFDSERFCDLIDLETAEKWEPPVTKDLSEETLLSAFASPFILPAYPNNTVKVEQMVRVVTESATKRVGYQGRHRLILQKLKSRQMVKSYNSKMQDAKF